jgi:hypothetical protein
MLNDPWIDPRSVDWTDSLSPLRNPGFSRNNNRYVFESLQSPMAVAVRNGVGLEPRVWVCPDRINQPIGANATIDFEVPSEPNTWLLAVNASGTGANFLIQITDAATGAVVFSQPAYASNMRGGPANRGLWNWLSDARLFAPPSYPVVRIINTDLASEQECTVNLLCAVELDLFT